jgi:hypothetical protein
MERQATLFFNLNCMEIADPSIDFMSCRIPLLLLQANYYFYSLPNLATS